MDNTQQITSNQREYLQKEIGRILFANSLGGRMEFAKKAGMFGQFGGHRQIREIAGYTTTPSFENYLEAYNYQDVAARVIETYPDHTWITAPEVYEVEDSTNTRFEDDWNDLVRERQVVAHLRRLDILAGIGRFGLLVIGVDDNQSLEHPLTPIRKKHNIVYMRAYMEGEVEIREWETNTQSSRYMLPTLYKITPVEKLNPRETGDGSFLVHHSRTIHFADHAMNGTVYGIPRLQRVFDRMTDILKIVAGSGEMFWRGAYQGFSFEADADANLTPEERKAMTQEIQNYFMGLDRAMLLTGVKTNPLNPSIASPKDHLDAQLTIIAIASRIPRRILTGSEMGKLASIQDAENWAQQIRIRRTNIAEPDILRPFVSFCIRNRIVSPLQDNNRFHIYWPNLEIPTDKDTSESALNFTNALEKYAVSGLFAVMPFVDYLTSVWKFSVAEAENRAKDFDEDKFVKLREVLNIKQRETTEPKKSVATTGESIDT